MTDRDIVQLRLQHQQISGTKHKTAGPLVGWMGAMQAQDFGMSKWAVGLRLPGKTEKDIQESFDRGKILRTHVLRPTWHLVAPGDIDWMLRLTGPRIIASMQTRHKELGLTDAILDKCRQIIKQAFRDELFLTRDELLIRMNKKGICTQGDNRAAHILILAELEGSITSGPRKGNRPTYALLRQRVSEGETLTRETALARLAARYFYSHGPATLEDFTWWSGLVAKEARAAVEMNGSKLASLFVGEKKYWLAPNHTNIIHTSPGAYLLPAFDELIISYKDRSHFLTADHHKKIISSNGIFRPVVLINGMVSGLWKRMIKGNGVTIETTFFRSPDKKERGLIEEAAEQYGTFLGKKAELIFYV